MIFTNALGQQTLVSATHPEWPGLPTELKLPTGATYNIEYTSIPGLVSPQTAYAVSRLVVTPNTTLPAWIASNSNGYEPAMTTGYKYTGVDNSNNYLGSGSGSSPSHDADPLLLDDFSTGYTYQVEQDQLDQYGNALTSSVQQYDRFHRVISSASYANYDSGNLLAKQTNIYQDNASTTFNGLSTTYQQPVETISQSYGVNGEGSKNSGNDLGSTLVVNTTQYNDNGNVTQSGSGYLDSSQHPVIDFTKAYTYFTPEEAGPFEHMVKQEIDTSSTLKGIITPSPTTATNQLASLSRVVEGKTYQQPYITTTSMATNEGVRLVKQSELNTDPSSPFFSLVANDKTSLPVSMLKGDAGNQSQTESYAYTLQGQGLKDFPSLKDFADINVSSTSSGSDKTIQHGSKTISPYNGQTKSKTDVLGNQMTYSYDKLGRVITETAFSNSAHPLTTRYQYNIGPSQGIMTVIQTDPTCGKSITTLDSLGRQIGSEVTDINHDATLIPVSSQSYNAQGHIDRKMDYIDQNSDGSYKTLTTYYQYDVKGEPIDIINPDGTADVMVHDRGRGQEIGYHLVSNGQKISGASLCHISDGSATGCKAYEFTVKRNDIAKHQSYSFTLLADSKAKRDNGSEVYSLAHQTELSGLETNLSAGKMIDASGLASFVAKTTGYSESSDESYKHSYEQYNTAGQVVYAVDSKGFKTSYVYNDEGQVTQKSSTANQGVYHYKYDPFLGKLTESSITDTGKDKTYVLGTNAYNALGELLSYTNANGKTVTSAYNDKGQLTSITNANGKITTYQAPST